MKELKLLMWKNWKIMSRDKFGTFLEVLAPVSIFIVFAIFRILIKSKDTHHPTIFEPFDLRDIPHVVRAEASVIFYTPSTPLTDLIMEKVSEKYFRNQGLNYTVEAFKRKRDMIEAYEISRDEDPNLASRGPVLAGIIFENLGPKKYPSNIKYTLRFPSSQRTKYNGFTDRLNLRPTWFTETSYPVIWFGGPRSRENQFGGFPGYYEEGFLYLQYALDRTVTRMLLNGSQEEEYNGFQFQLQRFPYPPHSHDKFLFFSEFWLAYFLAVAYVFSLMNLIRQIIHEKVSRLKEFMKIMGLLNWQHWVTWFLRSFSIVLIVSVVGTIIFKIEFKSGVAVFLHSNPVLIWGFLVIYGLTMITLSFLFATIFSSEDTGATVAAFIWLIAIFPFYSYHPKYFQLTRSAKIWRSLLIPNTAMEFAFLILGFHESAGVGLQWGNLSDGATLNDRLSILDCLLMMLFNSAVYLISALYLELAFPGKFGVKLPWYFPFTTWFWTGKPRQENLKHISPAKTSLDAFENAPEDWKAGVEFQKLCRHFGSKVAVNNLNFKMYENQVTALLGHNGAGKTTTMSMITGLIRPTSGTAFVNSFDICKDMGGVRESLGFCPQYNVLFDNLTVEEHLLFYCQLKGLGKSESLEEIERCLMVLGLEGKRFAQAKSLSGGMKRKLCVGIAFSAGSKVVLLDEPTAGMDPGSRRSTWDLIQHEKTRRTVILSTHYMEEADLLGDRVAIMAEGQLQCCGSSLFLKAKYGGAYNLVIVKKGTANVNAIKNIIWRSIPSVEFKEIGAELTCTLPLDQINLFPGIFEELECQKSEFGIGTYGVGSTTMQEIFIRVGELAEKEKKKNNPKFSNPLLSVPIHPPSQSQSVESLYTSLTGSMTNLYRTVKARNVGNKLLWQQFKAMVIKKLLVNTRKWTVATLQILVPPAMMFFLISILKSFPAFDKTKPLQISFQMYENEGKSTLLLNCEPNSGPCNSLANYNRPFRNILRIPDSSMASYILEEAEKSRRNVNARFLLGMEQTEFGKENDGKLFTMFFNNQPLHTPPLALNVLSNGILQHFGLPNTLSVTNYPFDLHPREEAFSQETFDSGYVVGVSLATSAAFLAGAFAILPVIEQTCKSKHLQGIAGVRLPLFWLAEFLVSYGISLVPGVLTLFAAIYKDIEELKTFHLQVKFLFMFGAFSFCALSGILFLSRFVESASSAYSKIVASFMAGGLVVFITVTLFSNPELNLEGLAKDLHNVAVIIPGYALASAIQQMLQLFTLKKACDNLDLEKLCLTQPESYCCTKLQESYFAWKSLGMGKQLASMLGTGVLFLILLAISESGYLRYLDVAMEKIRALQKPRVFFKRNYSMELQDSDVAKEDRRIAHSSVTTLALTDALIIKGLTKIYKGKLTAVDGLNLGVGRGEIFGLLGINGAGKTTTLKMLTGDISITSGDAYINSFSVREERRRAHAHLGYCPQFDACLEELTGRETLTMFGRIKGIPEENIPALITKVANNLHFSKFLDKQFGTLSGGNKRKLSTALAMLGDPPVLFLDEPTTGMDPVAARQVWNAISLARDSGASIIITSHNMEECEALCSNLAVMVRGRFKCLGSPQHLKSKLTPGFKLVAQVPYGTSNFSHVNEGCGNDWSSRLQEFHGFMENKFPGLVLKDAHPGFVQYTIPPTLSWSNIFKTMEDAKLQFTLDAYSVCQVDLEQVFFNFTQE